MKVDLITGFLGAGKTTFIHRYLSWLGEQGQTAAVIENEFGSADIDSILLKDDGCDVQSLAGQCMCCTGREEFRHMLIEAAKSGADRVIVEPSGIYDVDSFFDTMMDKNVSEHCEIGSILTIIDAGPEKTLTDESSYLVFAQLLAAGTVIMSKTQLYNREQIGETIQYMNNLLKEHGSSRILGEDVVTKNWEDLTDEDYRHFVKSGCHIEDHDKESMNHGEIFQSFMFASRCRDEEDLRRRIDDLFRTSKYGCVMRIKGHIKSLEDKWYEINCSPDVVNIRSCSIKRGIFVVIGQNLDENSIKNEAFIPKTFRETGNK